MGSDAHQRGPKVACVGGVTVSMVAFQAVDPGSTPGRRTSFFIHISLLLSVWRALLAALVVLMRVLLVNSY